MVEVFGRIEDNESREGEQVTTYLIPAFSESVATRRARANSRLKGFSDYSIRSTEVVGEGSVPGQSVYEVIVVTPR